MKAMKHLLLKLSLLAVLPLLFTSCLKDSCEETRTFTQYDPVYMSHNQIRVPIKTIEARYLENPGKMYFYENFIFVNEIREGIHIIDNSDPKNPSNIGFIEIPGNVDIAIRNNLMYADNYMDLITLDISNPLNPELVERQEEVYQRYYFHEGRGFLVYHRETQITAEVDCRDPRWNGGGFFWDGNVLFAADAATAEVATNGGTGNTGTVGIGGSLARFTIAKDHLYVIDNSTLYSFQIDGSSINQVSDLSIGWGIETIFPYGENLFIGSQDGMFIYNIDNPAEPWFASVFRHARACDPVFVSGNRAYVTLRDGTRCQTFNNQLDVLDVSDIYNPELLVTHEMQNPHGLSKVNDNLFICEGRFGLKSFDASDDQKIGDELLDHIKDIDAYDVIGLSSSHILVVGKDGLFQYDTSNPKKIEMISQVPIIRE